MSTNECVKFVLHCFGLELFTKIKKDLVSTHSQKSGLSKLKKTTHPFVDMTETCAKFQQKY